MPHYIINVKGEIIAYELTHYAQNWVCGGVGTDECPIDNYEYDTSTHSVKSNLVLNATKRAVPYAIYYTKKGIVATSTGDVAAWPGCGAALGYYRDNIATVQRQLNNLSISEDLVQPLYNGLFTDVFSILELFLSDVILCVIYSDEKAFNKAVDYYKLEKLRNTQVSVTEIEKRMHKFFFDEVVYHKFKLVDKLFKEIIGIELPECDDLSRFLHKRNNIVHRCSLSNIDRMQVTVVLKNDIEELIDASNKFTDQIIGKINPRIITNRF